MQNFTARMFLPLILFAVQGASAQTNASCFSYVPTNVSLTWTAYKTTDKVAVTGQFGQVTVTSAQQGVSIPALLDGAKFQVNLLTSSTGKSGRDQNLLNGFFSVISAPTASGLIANVMADPTTPNSGTFQAQLQLNGVTQNVAMIYSVDATQVFHAAGSLDMTDFMLGDALKALDGICHDVHSGADGVSKVWTNVDIAITIPLGNSCN